MLNLPSHETEDSPEIDQPKVIIAAQTGRTGGINWVSGYRLEIDPTTQTIAKVEPSPSDWRDSDLRRDAVLIDGMSYEDKNDQEGKELPQPKVGDPAPKGWEEWRK